MSAVGRAMLLCAAMPALAEDAWDPKRTAAAEALFQDARAKMAKGDYAAACPALEEVTRLEPRAPGAKVELAECYEAAGRLASAYATYKVAASSARDAGQPDREAWALAEAGKLAPRLSHLTIEVSQANLAIPDFTIERDGSTVGRAQWGVALPVDGGSLTITARAPGYASAVLRLDVGVELDDQRLVIPELARNVEAPIEPIETVVPPVSVPAPLPIADATIPAWVWIVGATGLATGLVGVGFRIDGAIVESEQSEACGAARDDCPTDFDVEGTNARKELDFNLFVGFGVAGLAALGTAAVGAIIAATTPAAAPPAVSLWADAFGESAVVGLSVQLR